MILRPAIVIGAVATLVASCGADDGSEYDVSVEAMTDGDGIAPWPLALEMTAEDSLTIEPAGDVHDDSGHFHVMIDTGCVEPGEAIPSDSAHGHFGDGSTSATLAEVEPGDHELCLQVGDGSHSALDATAEIAVSVGEVKESAWRDELNRRCRESLSPMDGYFTQFFGKWQDELEAGAGPEHPAADQMVADWYAAVDQITPIYADAIASVLSLPTPDTLVDDVAEMKSQAEVGIAAIEEMSVHRDPEFLFGDDDDFPLEPLIQNMEMNGISDCTG